jgi:hypothetical protein
MCFLLKGRGKVLSVPTVRGIVPEEMLYRDSVLRVVIIWGPVDVELSVFASIISFAAPFLPSSEQSLDSFTQIMLQTEIISLFVSSALAYFNLRSIVVDGTTRVLLTLYKRLP